MPSPGIMQGHAALQINSLPVAGVKIFCFADQWSLAVGKAQSVSCFHGCGTVSAVCALGRVFALWDLGLCPRRLHSGPGESQVWKGKRGKCASLPGMCQISLQGVPALVW